MADLDGKTDTLIKDQINAVALDFDFVSNCSMLLLLLYGSDHQKLKKADYYEHVTTWVGQKFALFQQKIVQNGALIRFYLNFLALGNLFLLTVPSQIF